MVIKILPSTASFSAVNYNENKNEQGKSELLHTSNFEALNVITDSPTKEDYKRYLQLVASENTRVKNPSFHAVVSAKGKEFSHEELKEIAIKYMSHMGYNNSPFLIYGHNDTKNNHVHIVSSRVDLDGKKVNHSFERTRSQSFLAEIGLGKKVDEDEILKELRSFRMTTTGQVKTLLDARGIKSDLKDGELKAFSGGKEIFRIPKKELEEITANKPDKKRQQQLVQIFKKYSAGMDFDSFSTFMRDKFGLQLIPHIAKGKSEPYGYTVIDNKEKSIFKGGDILKLSEFKHTPASNFNTLNAVIDNIPNKTLKEFESELKLTGHFLKNSEAVYSVATNQLILNLTKDQQRVLFTNEGIAKAREFSFSTEREKGALAHFFKVPAERIGEGGKLSQSEKNQINSHLISSASTQGPNTGSSKNNVPSIILHNGEFFAIDLKKKAIINLPLETQKKIAQSDYLGKNGIKPTDLSRSLQAALKEQVSNQYTFNHAKQSTSTNKLTNFISSLLNTKLGDNERDRRRKRNNSQNL